MLFFYSFQTTSVKLRIPIDEVKSIKVHHDIHNNRLSYDEYAIFYENVVLSRYISVFDGSKLQYSERSLAIEIENENGDSENFHWYGDYVLHYYNNDLVETYAIPTLRVFTDEFCFI